MNSTRYDFGDTVYVYRLLIEDIHHPNKHFITRVEFEDNLEGKLTQEYSDMYPNITCSKIEVENGKFTAEFNHYYGSYRNSYGPHLWNVVLRHDGLIEPINVGVQTYVILDILKHNTVTNAEIKNVYVALRGKDVLLVLDNDSRLKAMRYDDKVRHEYTKHKTVKRSEGYKYVTVASEFNYLCDVTFLATKVAWNRRYGEYSNFSDNFSYAIRCGRLPATLYHYSMDGSTETISVEELVKSELDKLEESLKCLIKSTVVKNSRTLNDSMNNFMQAINKLSGSIVYNTDTADSISLNSIRGKNRSLSKANAWLVDADSVDVKAEIMRLRDKCHEKLYDFITKYDIPLPPEFLNYLFRFDNEISADLTEHERAILESVEGYCSMVNSEEDTDRNEKIDTDIRFVHNRKDKYDTSELCLLY